MTWVCSDSESVVLRLIPSLADADPDPDQIWERLTEEERREFHTMLQSGALAEMVEDKHTMVAGKN